MSYRGTADRAWAIVFARMILGLIFFMAGFWKVFELGPLQHAHRYFVDPYAQTFLPRWSLWAAGVTVPFVELIGGALLLVGWRVRFALLGLGGVLVLVTFGHLLADPLYEFHTHVIPRSALLIILLVLPRCEDRMSLDHWLMRRRVGGQAATEDRRDD
jgi:thiosulfate dehydrogenase (quinone) large subunit